MSEDAARRVFTLEHTVRDGDPPLAADLLAALSGLPKLRIKDAMQKGAVWHARGRAKPARLRRVTTPLKAGDRLQLYYDSAVLALTPPPAALVADCRRYSVWHKPAGLLVEGSRFGDHATLAAQIAAHFTPRREVYLVHRLDLEASGLLLVAHSRQAAAKLSALFQSRSVDKRYRVEVLGDLRSRGELGRIDSALDGKPAVTEYRVEGVAEGGARSTVLIRMLSGRHHQIRRHFEAIGHPVIGDPRYGRGNEDSRGMRLAAIGIAFKDPWTQRPVRYGELPE
ncbi:MAG: RluA family pseudouridine synthase [Gammaproteobacteria bacterium]